jgi:hypothetical protein
MIIRVQAQDLTPGMIVHEVDGDDYDLETHYAHTIAYVDVPSDIDGWVWIEVDCQGKYVRAYRLTRTEEISVYS